MNLEQAGFKKRGHVVLLNGQAKELHEEILKALAKSLKPYYSNRLAASSVISRSTLGIANYIEHFPQNVIYVNKSKCKTPAACFHVFSKLNGKKINSKVGYLVIAPCTRHEGGRWKFPFRLEKFTMLELIILGRPEELFTLKKELRNTVEKTVKAFGCQGKWQVATDAFFLSTNKGAQVMQKLKELKLEYTVLVAKKSVALASFNSHESYFTERFTLAAGNAPLHSLCLAFGLERIVAASLLLRGKP